MVGIVSDPVDVLGVYGSVLDPECGGNVLFVGTTRENSRGRKVSALEYQAYVPMALKVMNSIAGEMRKRFGVRKVALVHRIGRLRVGDVSLVIAVSSEHRREAFKACARALELIKTSVPIWKREYFETGSEWVGYKNNPS